MSAQDEVFEKFRNAALQLADEVEQLVETDHEEEQAPADMSNDTLTSVAEYDDKQLIRDGALALRASEDQFEAWLAEERRVTLEMAAVELFMNCENLSQRAMRLRKALLDCPPDGEEDYIDETPAEDDPAPS